MPPTLIDRWTVSAGASSNATVRVPLGNAAGGRGDGGSRLVRVTRPGAIGSSPCRAASVSVVQRVPVLAIRGFGARPVPPSDL
ncbi:MAG: hypothetical protein K8W52_42365 [Deltaproteobacteria bacterium]|nr:hypothetical protein [Deltaproteobacteria bacterium]